MKRYSLAVGSLVVVLVLFVALLAGLAVVSTPASAAPPAVPTPVSVTRPATENGYITFNPFPQQTIGADTTSTCFDVAKYSVIDLIYTINQTTTNTITLTSKWSIDGVTLVSGVAVVAANTADATDMTQLQVFGRYFCLLADVANTNEIEITAQAIAK